MMATALIRGVKEIETIMPHGTSTRESPRNFAS